MEYIAITLLAAVLIIGVLLFIAFAQFREANRQTLSIQRQIQDQLQSLERKISRLEKPAPTEQDN